MVKIKCQDCERIVDVKNDWNISTGLLGTPPTCEKCGGYFKEYTLKEDSYKKEEIQEKTKKQVENVELNVELKKEESILNSKKFD